jgi:hypothetical protein
MRLLLLSTGVARAHASKNCMHLHAKSSAKKIQKIQALLATTIQNHNYKLWDRVQLLTLKQHALSSCLALSATQTQPRCLQMSVSFMCLQKPSSSFTYKTKPLLAGATPWCLSTKADGALCLDCCGRGNPIPYFPLSDNNIKYKVFVWHVLPALLMSSKN